MATYLADITTELGHIAKNCTQDKIEREKVEISCGNCKETGHRLRDW